MSESNLQETAAAPNAQPTRAQVPWGRVHATAFLALAAVALAASMSAPQPKAPPYEAKFEYATNAPATEPVGVTLAIVAPQFGTGIDQRVRKENATFRRYASAVTGSITELATAKGMTTKGPFADFNEMTYADKKDAGLALTPTFDVTLALTNEKVIQKQTQYTSEIREWDVSLDGTITLKIQEPASGESLWQKRVELEPYKFYIKGSTEQGAVGNLSDDDDFKKALEASYQTLMASLDKYLSPDEMKALNAQAAEIKAKKVY